jgi:predicted nucleotidyltransferase
MAATGVVVVTRRLRVDGRMLDVDARLPRLLERLGQEPRVAAAYLFGSYGTPEQTPLSDVDVALLLRPGTPLDPDLTLALVGLVIEALGEDDVSVVFLDRAPLRLQFEALRTGRLLYLADEVAVADFVEGVLRRFADYGPDRRALAADYDAAMREDLLGHGAG